MSDATRVWQTERLDLFAVEKITTITAKPAIDTRGERGTSFKPTS